MVVHQRPVIMSRTLLYSATVLVAFVSGLHTLVAQQAPAIEWQRALGGSLDEFGLAMDLTNDGGYIVAGSALSSNGDVPGNYGGTDWWVVKLDATGTVEWSRHYGGSSIEQPNSIRQTSDGGYIAAGSTRSNDFDVTGNQGLSDYWVVKLSAAGDIQWQRTYGGSAVDAAFDIEEIAEGGYVVVGETRSSDGDVSFNNGLWDCWLIKINSIGDLLWERSYGGSAGDIGYSIRSTSEGGFIIGAMAASSNGDITDPIGLEDFWVIKTDAQGEIEWQRNYGGTNDDFACRVIPKSDGGYIVGGTTFSNDGDIEDYSGLGDFWIAEIDGSGELVWSRTLGGSSTDLLQSLALLPSGDIVVSGFTDSIDGDVSANNGDRDGWLLRLSSTGVLLWERAMGGSGNDGFNRALPTPDGGYFMVGSSTSNDGDLDENNGGFDLWVVKLQSDPTTVEEIPPFGHLHGWPNPTAGRLWLDVREHGSPSFRIRIRSSSGTLVREQRLNATGGAFQIDLSGLSPGLYHVGVENGDRQGMVRVVKE